MTKDELELIESLRERSKDHYMECLEKAAAKYEFRKIYTQKMLNGFENSIIDNKIDRIRNNIININDRIQSYMDEISNLIERRKADSYTLIGLQTEKADDSELEDFFTRNSKLYLESVDGDNITFTVKDLLRMFDEDCAERMIANDSSYLYNIPVGFGFGKEDMRRFFKKVFIEQEYKIQFVATYSLSMRPRVRACGGWVYDTEFNDSMPNPHINGYSCLGGYESAIMQYMERGDFIGAMSQCIASCGSLDFTDGTVINKFASQIYGRENVNNRCVVLPDGRIVTPHDAVEYMKSQEGEENGEAD